MVRYYDKFVKGISEMKVSFPYPDFKPLEVPQGYDAQVFDLPEAESEYAPSDQ